MLFRALENFFEDMQILLDMEENIESHVKEKCYLELFEFSKSHAICWVS